MPWWLASSLRFEYCMCVKFYWPSSYHSKSMTSRLILISGDGPASQQTHVLFDLYFCLGCSRHRCSSRGSVFLYLISNMKLKDYSFLDFAVKFITAWFNALILSKISAEYWHQYHWVKARLGGRWGGSWYTACASAAY